MGKVLVVSNTGFGDTLLSTPAIKSLRNNKHIFSEKPLATNYSDALEMYEETTKKKLINMVNFSYRNSSGYQELAKIVQSGELGSVKHVEAAYYLSWLTSKNQGDWKVDDHLKWRLSTKHGSLGVLGDTGVHIIDFATYPVGRLKKINGLDFKSMQKIQNAIPLIEKSFFTSKIAGKQFIQILRSQFSLSTILKKLKQLGILRLLIPEFGEIEGQMQFDMFHIYTVDEHTFKVVRNMRQMQIGKIKINLKSGMLNTTKDWVRVIQMKQGNILRI